MFLLNLTRMEMGLILVELSIVVSFFIILFWVRRSVRSIGPGRPSGVRVSRRLAAGEMEKLSDLLQESQSISRRLTKHLEEKKEITHRLMRGLDEKIQTMDRQIHSMDRRGTPEPSPPPEKDVYARALEMSNAGVDPVEISRLLNLPKGEVQLISDLQKYSR